MSAIARPLVRRFFAVLPRRVKFAWNFNFSRPLRIGRDSAIKVNVGHHSGAGDRLTWISEPRCAASTFGSIFLTGQAILRWQATNPTGGPSFSNLTLNERNITKLYSLRNVPAK